MAEDLEFGDEPIFETETAEPEVAPVAESPIPEPPAPVTEPASVVAPETVSEEPAAVEESPVPAAEVEAPKATEPVAETAPSPEPAAETEAPAPAAETEAPASAAEPAVETPTPVEPAAAPMPAEPAPESPPAPAPTPFVEMASAAGTHPLAKIKSTPNSCIVIKGKLVKEEGKQFKYVWGQKATVTVKGYPVHIYGYAGMNEAGKVDVLPAFIHVGDGDAPWVYIIKELAQFGLFGCFIVADYSNDIRKGLAEVSQSTRHFSAVSSCSDAPAMKSALTRASYDFTTHFKRVWQNTGGRVEDCEKLELLTGMCVDTLSEFFKTKTYPTA